mgnify:CR=1 FL=1
MRNNLIYYPHQLQPILTAVNPYCAAAAASAYPQPHYYRQTSYGSPGAIPRVSW